MFARDVVIGKSHDIGLDCAMDWLDYLMSLFVLLLVVSHFLESHFQVYG